MTFLHAMVRVRALVASLHFFRDALGLNASNSKYLRIKVHKPGQGYGAINSGFRRMGVTANSDLALSAYVRAVGAGPKTIQAELIDERGQPIGSASLTG